MLILICIPVLRAQEPEPKDRPEVVADTVQEKTVQDEVKVLDTVKIIPRHMNPLAPSKAAFYSAILPGLGQIYNKRYWKVPLVYAAMGASIYGYVYNDDYYDRFRTAFKRRQAGFTDDEFWDLTPNNGSTPSTPDLDLEDLQNQQERFQRDRDLWLVVSIAMYALNIIDANVDAHLKQFNVSDELSFDIRPKVLMDPISNDPRYGLALSFDF